MSFLISEFMTYRKLTKIPWKIFNEYVFQFQNRIYRNEKNKKLLESNLDVLLKQPKILGPFLTERQIKKTFFSNPIQFQNRYKLQNLIFFPTVLTYNNYLIYKDWIQPNSFINNFLIFKKTHFYLEQKRKNINIQNESFSSDISLGFLVIQKKPIFLQKTFSSSWLLQLKAIQFIFQQPKFRNNKNFRENLDNPINAISKVQKLSFIEKGILSRETRKNSAFIGQNLKRNQNFLRKKFKHNLFSLVFEPQLENETAQDNYGKNSEANFYDAIELVFQLCQTKFWFCFFFQRNFLSNEKTLLFHYLKKLYAGVLLQNSKVFRIKNKIQQYPQKYLKKDFNYYSCEPSNFKKLNWSKVKIPLLFISNKKKLVLFYKIILFYGFYLPLFQKKIELAFLNPSSLSKLTNVKKGSKTLTLTKIFGFWSVSLINLEKRDNVKKDLINSLFDNLYLKKLALLAHYYFTFVFFTSYFVRLLFINRIDAEDKNITKFNLLNSNIIISFAKLIIFSDKNFSTSTNININHPQRFVSKINLIESISLIKNQKLLPPKYSFFLLCRNISFAHLTTKLLTFSLKKQSFFFYPFVSKKKINPIQIIKFDDQILIFSSDQKLYFKNIFCLKEIEQKLTIIKKIVYPISKGFEKNLESYRLQELLLFTKSQLNKNFCSNYLLSDYTSSTNFKKTRLDFLDFEIRIFQNRRPFFTKKKSYLIPSKKQILIHLQEIRYIIKNSKTKNQEDLISKLAPKIYQWSIYYKNVSTKKIFNYCDYLTLKLIWKWACRKHPKKSRQWIKCKYFVNLNTRNWVFGVYQKTHFSYFCLPYHVDVHLEKHSKILNRKLPYDGDFKYWSRYF
nr:hypothetical protein [Microspora sp. UTEX LB472]